MISENCNEIKPEITPVGPCNSQEGDQGSVGIASHCVGWHGSETRKSNRTLGNGSDAGDDVVAQADAQAAVGGMW